MANPNPSKKSPTTPPPSFDMKKDTKNPSIETKNKNHTNKTGGRSRKVRRNRSNKKRGFQRRSSRSTK